MIRSRLTYANVMATIAVFLALGGGAYAVNLKLKQNQVKTRNIAPDAVTGGKALESSFGQVPSAGQANNATTATTATNAANATNATNAANANMLDGLSAAAFQRRGYRIDATTSNQPSVVGLSAIGLIRSSPTAIINLAGGIDGQMVTVTGSNSNVTIADGGFFSLTAPWIAASTDTLTVVFFEGGWQEVSRANN